MRRDHLLQPGVQILPAAVDDLASRQTGEFTWFDTMIQFDRLAMRWDQVIPAARSESGAIEAENAVSDRVAMTEVGEEPGIDALFPQRGLNSRKIQVIYPQQHCNSRTRSQ